MDEGGDQADRVELREFIRHVCSVQELEQEEEVTTDVVQTIDSTHWGTIFQGTHNLSCGDTTLD